MPPHPTSWRSNFILSSHLRLGLPSGLFPSGFPQKPCIHISSTQTCYMPHLSHSSWFDHQNSIGCAVQIIKLSIVYFSHFPCSLIPLRSKYSQHPQPTFLPQCERPSFTPIKNNRQNYSAVYLNTRIYIFGQQTGRQKILHRMTASIPWLQSALNLFLNRILIC